MKSFIGVFVVAVFTTVNASVIIGPSVYNAPITLSRAPYVHPVHPSVYAAPVVPAQVVAHHVVSHPVVAQPVVAQPVVAQPVVAQPVVYSSPVKSLSDETVISGPSGIITTKKELNTPGVVVTRKQILPVAAQLRYSPPRTATYSKVKLVASPFGPVPEGHGAEGLYVPDYREKYYDDGSYRSEHY